METSSSSRSLEAAAAVTSLMFLAAALGLLAWLALPPQRQTQARLGLLRSYRRVMSLRARRTAVRSMARELRTGEQDYSESYRLALRVDAIDGHINLVRQGLA